MKLRVFSTPSEARAYIEKNRAACRQLYVTQGLTARVTAARLGVAHSQAWAKALHTTFPKNMGRGGARLGAGIKKGTTFCKVCRHVAHSCTCPKPDAE